MASINFKQFYYTHALKGVYSTFKGWQAVGVSGKDYFKPLVSKLYTLANITEVSRLPEDFTLFGLNYINELPILIRVKSFGVTSDGRPGNILAHMLIPESISDFYTSDVLSIFTQWDSFSQEWDGEPKEDVEVLEAYVNTYPDRETLEDAIQFAGNEKRLRDIVTAAQTCLNPLTPQHLVIQPGQESHPADGIQLLRIIWSFLIIPQRKHVKFWIGRNQVKLAGIPWIILNEYSKAPLPPVMFGRSAFGFDFIQNKYTDCANIIADNKALSEIDLSWEEIKERNEYYHFINDVFAYYGNNLERTENIIRICRDSNNDIIKICQNIDTVQHILTVPKPKDDEILSVIKSLFRFLYVYIRETGNIENRLFASISTLNLNEPRIKNKVGDIIFSETVNLLTSTLNLELSFEQQIEFITNICVLFESIGEKYALLKSKISIDNIWIDIGEKLQKHTVERTSQSRKYWQYFKKLIFQDILKKRYHIIKIFKSPLLKKKIEWLERVPFDDSIISQEAKWYAKLLRDILHSEYQAEKKSGSINTVRDLYIQAPSPNEKELLFSYIDGYYEKENPVFYWVNLYRIVSDPEEKGKIKDRYFSAIQGKAGTVKEINQDNSLLADFLDSQSIQDIRNEIKARMLFIYHQCPKPSVSYNLNMPQAGEWKQNNISLNYQDFSNKASEYLFILLNKIDPVNNPVTIDLSDLFSGLFNDGKLSTLERQCNTAITIALFKYAENYLKDGRGKDVIRLMGLFSCCDPGFIFLSSAPNIQDLIHRINFLIVEILLKDVLKRKVLNVNNEDRQKIQTYVKSFNVFRSLEKNSVTIFKIIKENEVTFSTIKQCADLFGDIQGDNYAESLLHHLETIKENIFDYFPGLYLYNFFYQSKDIFEKSDNFLLEFFIRIRSLNPIGNIKEFSKKLRNILNDDIVMLKNNIEFMIKIPHLVGFNNGTIFLPLCEEAFNRYQKAFDDISREAYIKIIQLIIKAFPVAMYEINYKIFECALNMEGIKQRYLFLKNFYDDKIPNELLGPSGADERTGKKVKSMLDFTLKEFFQNFECNPNREREPYDNSLRDYAKFFNIAYYIEKIRNDRNKLSTIISKKTEYDIKNLLIALYGQDYEEVILDYANNVRSDYKEENINTRVILRVEIYKRYPFLSLLYCFWAIYDSFMPEWLDQYIIFQPLFFDDIREMDTEKYVNRLFNYTIYHDNKFAEKLLYSVLFIKTRTDNVQDIFRDFISSVVSSLQEKYKERDFLESDRQMLDRAFENFIVALRQIYPSLLNLRQKESLSRIADLIRKLPAIENVPQNNLLEELLKNLNNQIQRVDIRNQNQNLNNNSAIKEYPSVSTEKKTIVYTSNKPKSKENKITKKKFWGK